MAGIRMTVCCVGLCTFKRFWFYISAFPSFLLGKNELPIMSVLMMIIALSRSIYFCNHHG